MDKEKDNIFETYDRNLYRLGMEQDSPNDVVDTGNLSIAPVSNELTGAGDLPPNYQDSDVGNSGSQVKFTEQGNGTLQAGKLDFNNATTGYILGIDSTDGLAKFYIGSTTAYLNWDGTNLTISGSNVLTTTLASGNIFVGNGSNVATGVAMSGDATLNNAGAITFATVNLNVGSFTNASITVNAKGLVTAAASGASGSGALYSVNSDEAVTTWITSYIGPGVWSASSTVTNYANGTQASTATGGSITVATGFRDAVFSSTLARAVQFGDARSFKIKFVGQAPTPNGTGVSQKNAFFGFSKNSGTGQDFGDITKLTTPRIGFAFNDATNTGTGEIYIITCNGSAATATSVVNPYTSKLLEFAIVVNGTTSADFYINGSLVGSISTNMPSTTDIINLNFENYDGTGGTTPIFIGDCVLSQKTS